MGKITILLIEDVEVLRLVLTDVLMLAGYEVIEAEDGRVGVEKLAQHKIDLLITDIYMPSQDGIETILHIRREHPHMPVIAMSGGSQVALAIDVLKAATGLGADASIEKPFRNQELLDLIDEVLATP